MPQADKAVKDLVAPQDLSRFPGPDNGIFYGPQDHFYILRLGQDLGLGLVSFPILSMVYAPWIFVVLDLRI